MQGDPKEANSQYMKEQIYRAHFASMSSIARNFEWLDGMAAVYEKELYLPFAASMRSLIESTADSFDSLLNVSVTIAEASKIINDCLNKRASGFYTITELENDLIHYTHARRIEKEEKAPKAHKAKNASTYVQNLDKKTGHNFYSCYSELCQLTHPAAQGVLHMMLPINDSDYFFDNGFGKEKIDHLIETYKSSFPDLISFAFNPGLLTLKVLNSIDLESCKSEYLNNINFDHVPAWSRCKAELDTNRT